MGDTFAAQVEEIACMENSPLKWAEICQKLAIILPPPFLSIVAK